MTKKSTIENTSLPAGWKTMKLVDVCIVERGSSPRPIKKYITDDEDGVNWIKIGDTKKIEKYIYQTNQKITKEGAAKSRYVEEGDFILSNSMSFGKPYIMKTQGYIHDGWFKLKLHDFVNTEYFYQLLSSPLVNNQFHNLASGSVVKNISGDLVKKVVLPIPPLPKQKQIVAILDKAFAAIDTAKANAEQNLQNAKELFESYLQNVFENKGDDWEEKTLNEVYDVRDGTHDSPKYINEGYALITSKNLKNDELNYNKIKYISEQDYININKRSKVDKGDVLFAMIGTIGNPIVIKKEPDFAIKNVALFKIPLKQSSYFLKYYLDSSFVIDKMIKDAKGATQKFVGLGYLRSFPISLPPLAEQEELVKKLNTLSLETKKLEAIYTQKLADLEEMKKSVLQKAFSGQLNTIN